MTATAADFPAGTIVIKDMLDTMGNRAGLTIMAKGVEGGVVETNGWWWGAYGADSSFSSGGNIGFCITCHRGNDLERTDWVAGVAMDNRVP